MRRFSDNDEKSDFFNALLGLQIYAEYNAGGCVSMDRVKDAFLIHTDMHAETFLAMDIDDLGDDNPKYDYSAPYSFSEVEHCIPVISKQVFYQDPLTGLFDKNFSYIDLSSHYKSAYKRLKKCKTIGFENSLHSVALAFSKVVMKKCDIGIRLKQYYDEKNKEALVSLVKDLKVLVKDVEKLHGVYSKHFYEHYKPFGFEEKDMRIGGVCARLRRAATRVQEYLAGKIDAIEELEVERLSFENRETPFAHLYYVEKMRRP